MCGKWSQNSPIRTYVLCELIMRMRVWLMDGADALYTWFSFIKSNCFNTFARSFSLYFSIP